jgi:hypothetical protein
MRQRTGRVWLMALIVVVGVTAALWVRNPSRQRVDITQPRAEQRTAPLRPGQRLVQTFTPTRDGMQALVLQVALQPTDTILATEARLRVLLERDTPGDHGMVTLELPVAG